VDRHLSYEIKEISKMQFIEQTPSRDVLLAYAHQLPDFLKSGSPAPPPDRTAKAQIYQLFTLGLQDLAGGKDLGVATTKGWRFVTTGRGNGTSAAVLDSGPGGVPTMTGLSRGPQAKLTVQTFDAIRKSPQPDDRSYEMRLLAIPGLLTEAVWLKSVPDSAATDMVVPYLVISKKLVAGTVYKRDDFMAIVKELAAERLDYDDTATDTPSKAIKPKQAPVAQQLAAAAGQ
jgi:hypothetical protein